MTELVPVKQPPLITDFSSQPATPNLYIELADAIAMTGQVATDAISQKRRELTQVRTATPQPDEDLFTTRGTLRYASDVYDVLNEAQAGELGNVIANVDEADQLSVVSTNLALSLARVDPAWATTGNVRRLNNLMDVLAKVEEANPDAWYEDLTDVEEIIRPLVETPKSVYNYLFSDTETALFDEEQQAFVKAIERGEYQGMTGEEIINTPEFRNFTAFDNVDYDISKLAVANMLPEERSGIITTNLLLSAIEFTSFGIVPLAANAAKGAGARIINIPAYMASRRHGREMARRHVENMKRGQQEAPKVDDLDSVSQTPLRPDQSAVPPELVSELSEDLQKSLNDFDALAVRIEELLARGGDPEFLVNGAVRTNDELGLTAGSFRPQKWNTPNGEEMFPSMTIRSSTGQHFSSLEAAMTSIEDLMRVTGLPKDRFKVRSNGADGFEIVARADDLPTAHPKVQESPLSGAEIPEGWTVSNALRGLFQKPSNYLDEAYTPSQAEGLENFSVEALMGGVKDVFSRLVDEGASIQGVNNAIDLATLRDGIHRWLSPQEFRHYFSEATGKTATAADEAAYGIYRSIDDRGWRLRGYDEKARKVAEGFVRLSFGADGKRVARDVFESSLPERIRAGDEVAILRNGSLVKLNPNELSSHIQDMIVWETRGEVDNIRYIIDDGSGQVGEVLAREQVEYLGGGRLNPTYNHYIKAAMPDGTSMTLFGSAIRGEARQFARQVPDLARLVVRARTASESELRAISAQVNELGFGTINTLEDAKDFFIEAVKSLENSKLNPDDIVDEIANGKIAVANYRADEQVSRLSSKSSLDDKYDFYKQRHQFARSTRRIRNVSRKSDREFLYASPFDAMSREIQVSTRLGATGLEQQRMMDAFMEQFGQYANKNGHPLALVGQKDLPEVVLEGFKRAHGAGALPVSDSAFKAAVSHTQRQIQHFFRMQHPINAVVDSTMDGVADMAYLLSRKVSDVVGRRVYSLSEVLSGNFTPIETATAFMMDAKLGLFNPQQAFVQATWAPIIAAGRGTKFNFKEAVDLNGLFRTLVQMPDDAAEATIKQLEKAGFYSFSGEDMLELRRLFQESGFSVYGRSHIMDDTLGSTTGARFGGEPSIRSSIREGVENVRYKGRFIFKQADLIPRITAFLDGAAEQVKNGAKLTDPATREAIFKHTNKWVLGTTGVDTPVLIKRSLGGASRPLLQFQSYVFKAWGALFGKEFAPAEKVRLFSAYLVSSGKRSLPLYHVVKSFTNDHDIQTDYQKLVELVGEDYASIAIFIDSGLYDAMIHEAFGVETSIGQRIAIDPITPLYDTWISNKYNTSPSQAFLGAFGSGSGQYFREFDRLNYLVNPDAGGSYLNYPEYFIRSVGRVLSTYAAADRMYIAMAYGELRDSKGGYVMDVTMTEAILMNIVGAPLKDVEERYRMMDISGDRGEILRRYTQIRMNLKRDALNYEEGSEDFFAATANAAAINEFLLRQGYSNEEILSAQQGYLRQNRESLIDVVKRRLENAESIRRARTGEEE